VTLLRSSVIAAIAPIERFFHGIGYKVRYGWSNYVDLRGTKQENHTLKDEVARLRLEQAQLAEDALQGHRLQTLLNFPAQLRQHHRRGAGHRGQRNGSVACAVYRQGS